MNKQSNNGYHYKVGQYAIEAHPFRKGNEMFLNVVVYTPWGPLSGQFAVEAGTAKRAIASMRKAWIPSLYDFITERPTLASVGSPSAQSLHGAVRVDPRSVGM